MFFVRFSAHQTAQEKWMVAITVFSSTDLYVISFVIHDNFMNVDCAIIVYVLITIFDFCDAGGGVIDN